MRYLVKKGKESRGIIFVRTRALAEALSKWLTRCDNTALKELNPCSFTGSNTPEDKGGTSQAHQEAIIQRFKSGEVRLLVATSVAEEGLDIEKCNLVIKYNHVGSEVSTVQTRGRSRAFGGVSVLLAMGNILQKENINRCRVELMQQAIEKIQAMDPTAFKAAVEAHQKELLQSAYIAELVQRRRRSQYQSVPFKMLCALCRKVGVENTGVRIVSDSCHVSIDRNLLDHIEVVPEKQPKVIEDCLIVGTVLCKGEPEPGSKCKRQLGRVIKHEKIPFVMLDIRSFSFEIGSQMKLAVYKQWKETNFTIDNLNYYDIERYLEDDRVLSNPEPV